VPHFTQFETGAFPTPLLWLPPNETRGAHRTKFQSTTRRWSRMSASAGGARRWLARYMAQPNANAHTQYDLFDLTSDSAGRHPGRTYSGMINRATGREPDDTRLRESAADMYTTGSPAPTGYPRGRERSTSCCASTRRDPPS
jgi:hypothetical protein